MMNDDQVGEEVKEVYARFGLAVYHAQVLEHGIVNALVVLDLIPSRRHLTRSPDEWGSVVDAFMDRHFETPMGSMMRSLRGAAEVPSDLEDLLRNALKRRNWLAHDFFRERAHEFLTSAGRDQMLAEVDECRACFEAADKRLDEIIRPLRNKAGITDQMLEREYQKIAGRRHDG
jgi:hypothetical protein